MTTQSSTQPVKVVYTAEATSTGGRQGRAVSSDGLIDLSLTAPTELGGPGTGTNPEQLFAAGYSACFNSALGAVAKKARVNAAGSTVTARIGLGSDGEGGYVLTAELVVAVPGLSRDEVQELADAAHQVCPYSRAMTGNVPVTITAEGD